MYSRKTLVVFSVRAIAEKDTNAENMHRLTKKTRMIECKTYLQEELRENGHLARYLPCSRACLFGDCAFVTS